jgi:hypothetical protein
MHHVNPLARASCYSQKFELLISYASPHADYSRCSLEEVRQGYLKYHLGRKNKLSVVEKNLFCEIFEI